MFGPRKIWQPWQGKEKKPLSMKKIQILVSKVTPFIKNNAHTLSLTHRVKLCNGFNAGNNTPGLDFFWQ
jgi:hypothetical protein